MFANSGSGGITTVLCIRDSAKEVVAVPLNIKSALRGLIGLDISPRFRGADKVAVPVPLNINVRQHMGRNRDLLLLFPVGGWVSGGHPIPGLCWFRTLHWVLTALPLCCSYGPAFGHGGHR